MTQPDYPDFVRPVAEAEKSSLLATLNCPAAGNVQTATLDTSQLNSISVVAVNDFPSDGVAFLVITWLDDGNHLLSYETYSFWTGTADWNGAGLIGHFGIRGPKCIVQIMSESVTAVVTARINGSTRGVSEIELRDIQSSSSHCLLAQINVAVPISGSLGPFQIGPVARAITIVNETQNALIRVDLQSWQLSPNGLAIYDRLSSLSTGNRYTIEDIDVPGLALLVTLVNTSAVAHNATVLIWDVS